MSVHVSSRVWKLAPGAVSAHEKIVLLKLADCCDDEGRNAWPAVATIARECDLSARTVQRVLKALVKNGLIAVQSAGGGGAYRPTTYQIVGGDSVTLPVRARGDKRDSPGVTTATPRGDKRRSAGVTKLVTRTVPKNRPKNRPLEPSPLTPRKTGGTPASRAKNGSKRKRDVVALRATQTIEEQYLGAHAARMRAAFAARARTK